MQLKLSEKYLFHKGGVSKGLNKIERGREVDTTLYMGSRVLSQSQDLQFVT